MNFIIPLGREKDLNSYYKNLVLGRSFFEDPPTQEVMFSRISIQQTERCFTI